MRTLVKTCAVGPHNRASFIRTPAPGPAAGPPSPAPGPDTETESKRRAARAKLEKQRREMIEAAKADAQEIIRQELKFATDAVEAIDRLARDAWRRK